MAVAGLAAIGRVHRQSASGPFATSSASVSRRGSDASVADSLAAAAEASSGRLTLRRPNFSGVWMLAHTTGLDEYLKALGTGWVKRAAVATIAKV